jgi:hypothetical protein
MNIKNLSIYLSIYLHLRDLRPRRRGALALSAADLWSARVGRGGGCALPHTIPAARRGELARVATQGCPPLFRSAITIAARRGLAAGIRRSTCTACRGGPLRRAHRLARSAPPDARRPARCFDCPVDPAPAEHSDLAAYCGSLVAYG